MAFPLRLQRRDVDDDATASIGRLTQADSKHISRDAEIFYSPCQGEGVWRNDAERLVDRDKTGFIKILWVHYAGRVHIRKNFEFGGAAHIVAVT